MNVFDSIAYIVDYIYDKETVYNDYSIEEISEWLEQLNQEQFKQNNKFYE